MSPRQSIVVVALVLVLLFGIPAAATYRAGGGLRLVTRHAARRMRQAVPPIRRPGAHARRRVPGATRSRRVSH